MRGLGVLAISLFALAGCARPALRHDTAYYADHEAARRVRVAVCSRYPGAPAAGDCAAALQAQAAAESQRALQYTRPASRLRRPGVL